MDITCDHPPAAIRRFTPCLDGRALTRGGTVCTRCGATGEGTRVPSVAGHEHHPEGASWYLAPMIVGREAILLRVGGVKRLAVVWVREAPRKHVPRGRLLVRIWTPNRDLKSSVPGAWSPPAYARIDDEHGPAPWDHPRLYAATMGATWGLDEPSDTPPSTGVSFCGGREPGA